MFLVLKLLIWFLQELLLFHFQSLISIVKQLCLFLQLQRSLHRLKRFQQLMLLHVHKVWTWLFLISSPRFWLLHLKMYWLNSFLKDGNWLSWLLQYEHYNVGVIFNFLSQKFWFSCQLNKKQLPIQLDRIKLYLSFLYDLWSLQAQCQSLHPKTWYLCHHFLKSLFLSQGWKHMFKPNFCGLEL